MPRTVPAGLLSAIQSGATSLCNLIRITDAIGGTLALTDHIQDLSVSSVTYLARPGMKVSLMKTSGNMEIDNYEIEGYFVAGVVTMADLLKGRFTGARVRRYIVNYDDLTDGVLQIGDGNVSRVEVADNAFRVQVLGKMWRLSQPVGRTVTKRCDVETLGDARCQFNLDTTTTGGTAPYKQNLTVSGVTNAITFDVTGYNLSAGGSEFFRNGRVTWVTGDNAGYTQQVASQSVGFGELTLTLRTQPGADIDIGDTLIGIAGCDRTPTDCQFKFRNSAQPNGNLVNYRGFPGLIGTDIYLTAAKIKAIDDAGGRTPY
jgi:uncharacterized phage protein (TIGR02218 family)